MWAFEHPERKATRTSNDVYGTLFFSHQTYSIYVSVQGNQTVSMGPYEPLRIENRPKQNEGQPIPKSQWSQTRGTISNVNIPCCRLGRSKVLGRGGRPIGRCRDRASACLVIVFNEPIDRLFKALLKWCELEFFVILTRLAHKSDQLLVRRRLAVLAIRLARVELCGAVGQHR